MLRSIAIAAACAGMLSGCGTTLPGTPNPTTVSSGPTAAALPARPRDLPLAAVDPCSLLDVHQAELLNVEDPTPGTTTEQDGGRYPHCDWTHESAGPYQIYRIIVRHGRPASDGLESVTDASVSLIKGFPAVETTRIGTDPDHTCSEYLDTAANESIEVAYRFESNQEEITHAQSCANARRAAEMVLQNLTARFPG